MQIGYVKGKGPYIFHKSTVYLHEPSEHTDSYVNESINKIFKEIISFKKIFLQVEKLNPLMRFLSPLLDLFDLISKADEEEKNEMRNPSNIQIITAREAALTGIKIYAEQAARTANAAKISEENAKTVGASKKNIKKMAIRKALENFKINKIKNQILETQSLLIAKRRLAQLSRIPIEYCLEKALDIFKTEIKDGDEDGDEDEDETSNRSHLMYYLTDIIQSFPDIISDIKQINYIKDLDTVTEMCTEDIIKVLNQKGLISFNVPRRSISNKTGKLGNHNTKITTRTSFSSSQSTDIGLSIFITVPQDILQVNTENKLIEFNNDVGFPLFNDSIWFNEFKKDFVGKLNNNLKKHKQIQNVIANSTTSRETLLSLAAEMMRMLNKKTIRFIEPVTQGGKKSSSKPQSSYKRTVRKHIDENGTSYTIYIKTSNNKEYIRKKNSRSSSFSYKAVSKAKMLHV